jgi:hypothetical protein
MLELPMAPACSRREPSVVVQHANDVPRFHFGMLAAGKIGCNPRIRSERANSRRDGAVRRARSWCGGQTEAARPAELTPLVRRQCALPLAQGIRFDVT